MQPQRLPRPQHEQLLDAVPPRRRGQEMHQRAKDAQSCATHGRAGHAGGRELPDEAYARRDRLPRRARQARGLRGTTLAAVCAARVTQAREQRLQEQQRAVECVAPRAGAHARLQLVAHGAERAGRLRQRHERRVRARDERSCLQVRVVRAAAQALHERRHAALRGPVVDVHRGRQAREEQQDGVQRRVRPGAAAEQRRGHRGAQLVQQQGVRVREPREEVRRRRPVRRVAVLCDALVPHSPTQRARAIGHVTASAHVLCARAHRVTTAVNSIMLEFRTAHMGAWKPRNAISSARCTYGGTSRAS